MNCSGTQENDLESKGFLRSKQQLRLPGHRETQLPKRINSILLPREPQEGQGQEKHGKQIARGWGGMQITQWVEGSRGAVGSWDHLHP